LIAFQTGRKWRTGVIGYVDDVTIRSCIENAVEGDLSTLSAWWEDIDGSTEKFKQHERAVAEVEGSIDSFVIEDPQSTSSKLSNLVDKQIENADKVV